MGDEYSERYQEDGFVALGPLVDPEHIGLLRDACVRSLDQVHPNLPDGGRYSITRPGDLADHVLSDLLRDAGAIAARLLEGDVVPTFVLWHATNHHVGDSRGWHQGLAYYHLPYSPNGVSVPLDEIEFLVALDDAATDGTAPVFAPGYHVMPMLEHRRIDGATAVFELVDAERQLAMAEPVVVPMRAGDAIAYTLGTPHACGVLPEGEAPSQSLSMRLGFRVTPF